MSIKYHTYSWPCCYHRIVYECDRPKISIIIDSKDSKDQGCSSPAYTRWLARRRLASSKLRSKRTRSCERSAVPCEVLHAARVCCTTRSILNPSLRVQTDQLTAHSRVGFCYDYCAVRYLVHRVLACTRGPDDLRTVDRHY